MHLDFANLCEMSKAVMRTMQHRSGLSRLIVLLIFVLSLSTSVALSGGTAKVDCTLGPDDEEGTSSPRFRFAGGCLQVSGSTQFTGQRTTASEPRGGEFPTAKRLGDHDTSLRVDLARETAAGWFMLAFESRYAWNTDTGPDDLASLEEASIRFRGLTFGFSSSLMDFWDGAFQFKASVPSLSTYLAVKEFEINQTTTLAIGVEAGPPSSRGASTWQLPDDPPYVTTRLKYEQDDVELQLSAAVRQIDVSRTPVILSTAETRIGWAVTTGARVPLAITGEGDNASVVLTYAVDSRVFLGTPNDAAALAAIFPGVVPLPSTGWSALISYQHYWSDKLSSSFFASHVAASLDHALATPRVRTSRYAANLVYEPAAKWEIGIEAGYLDTSIEPGGALGVASSGSFNIRSGFVWVRRAF